MSRDTLAGSPKPKAQSHTPGVDEERLPRRLRTDAFMPKGYPCAADEETVRRGNQRSVECIKKIERKSLGWRWWFAKWGNESWNPIGRTEE
jgi:hypothetical protein